MTIQSSQHSVPGRGISKSKIMKFPYLEKHEEEDCVLALFAKAFGHPARLRILRYLYEGGPSLCGDIADQIPLTFGPLSRHLRILRETGIIHGTPEGVNIRYRIEPAIRKLFAKQLKGIRSAKVDTAAIKENTLKMLAEALLAVLEFPSDVRRTSQYL